MPFVTHSSDKSLCSGAPEFSHEVSVSVTDVSDGLTLPGARHRLPRSPAFLQNLLGSSPFLRSFCLQGQRQHSSLYTI